MGMSSRSVTERNLCELWSHVCAALEEGAPASALPGPAADVAVELISLPFDKSSLPAASPVSFQSTVASARTTGTKSSPWSLANAAAFPGIPQFSDFQDATSVDYPGTPGLSSSAAGDMNDMSPSMVDATQLRLKLEKLANYKRRPSKDMFPRIYCQAEPPADGPGTPLSVQSVSVPPSAQRNPVFDAICTRTRGL